MSEKLKIVYRPLQELSPYAHNARTHSTEQVAQLVESIKQFGWTNPVLIDEKGEIIAGHGRVMAAEMLKMDSVPVIVLSGLTDEQKKAYRLADNRLPMNAGWDEDLLRMELSDLINADFDVSLTGFIPTEIDELLTDVLPGTGNEEEPYTTKIDTPVYEPSGGKPDIPGKFLSLLMMKIRHGISTWLNLVNRCWCFPKPISPVVLTKPIISVTAAQFFTPVMPVSTRQNWSGVNTSFSSMMIITSSSFGWIATMTRPIFR
ncbi:ParB/Srx family N-terminal domain-containing protein [Escherichia coli]|nr:ParB/Srx family N-terminal domain-containing protein [Escherichia coli]